ncbi:MAG: anti-sigma factor family protein [Myxococcaceae bacterium]
MTCSVTSELTAYLDEALDPLARAQVEAHLPTCVTCNQALAELREAALAMSRLSRPEPSPERSMALRRRVMSQIAQEPLPWRMRLAEWAKPARWVPAAALTGAATVLVTYSVMNSSNDSWKELEPQGLELAANYEVLEDMDVLGLESTADVEVVAALHELEEKQ